MSKDSKANKKKRGAIEGSGSLILPDSSQDKIDELDRLLGIKTNAEPVEKETEDKTK